MLCLVTGKKGTPVMSHLQDDLSLGMCSGDRLNRNNTGKKDTNVKHYGSTYEK